jgi:hypothetical protein
MLGATTLPSWPGVGPGHPFCHQERSGQAAHLWRDALAIAAGSATDQSLASRTGFTTSMTWSRFTAHRLVLARP